MSSGAETSLILSAREIELEIPRLRSASLGMTIEGAGLGITEERSLFLGIDECSAKKDE